MRLAGVEDIGGEAMSEVMSTESWLLPLAGISLLLGGVALFIAWLATWNPWCLVGALGCYALISAK